MIIDGDDKYRGDDIIDDDEDDRIEMSVVGRWCRFV